MWAEVVSFGNKRICLQIMVIFLVIFFLLPNFLLSVVGQENITVRNYLEGKFDSAVFYLYLDSMDDLNTQEMEFIDLLTGQPKDRQAFYGKIVYHEGFDLELLDKLKKEIEEREEQITKAFEDDKYEVSQLLIPTLPPMKLLEKMYARMVSMQRVITTTDYNRFSICGVDPARSERVVKRVKNYFDWCNQWTIEGKKLEELAENAQEEGNLFLARRLFHSAAGCYHIGAFINYYDIEEKRL